MKVTIEIDTIQEIQQLITMLNDLNIEHFSIIGNQDTELQPVAVVTKGNKDIDPSELYGIWKDAPKTIDYIRKEGWQRNWN